MYTKYFGFRSPPFPVTADPSVFYANAPYTRVYSAVSRALRAQRGLILLTGEPGTGKTTLLRRVARSVDPGALVTPNEKTAQPQQRRRKHHRHRRNSQPTGQQWMSMRAEAIPVAFLPIAEAVSFAEIVQFLCQWFGLKTATQEDPAVRLDALLHALRVRARQYRTVVLFIDEAQTLPAETLGKLHMLLKGSEKRRQPLQVVLAGQPELTTKLGEPALRQLRQDIAVHRTLTSLPSDEVGAFIDYRLRAAGYDGPTLFPPDVVAQVARASQAIPRVINGLCENALCLTYGLNQRVVSPEILAEVISDLQWEETGGSDVSYTSANTSPVTEFARVGRFARLWSRPAAWRHWMRQTFSFDNIPVVARMTDRP